MISGTTHTTSVTEVLVLIIESGMIYSAALIIEISLYFSGSNAFYIIYDPIAQLTVSRIDPLPLVFILLIPVSQVDRADHDSSSRRVQTNFKRH